MSETRIMDIIELVDTSSRVINLNIRLRIILYIAPSPLGFVCVGASARLYSASSSSN